MTLYKYRSDKFIYKPRISGNMIKQLSILVLLLIMPIFTPIVSAYSADTISEITLQQGDTNVWILADYKDVELMKTINSALNTGSTVKISTLGVTQDSILAGVYGECIFEQLGKEKYLSYVDDLYYGNTEQVASSYINTDYCGTKYEHETKSDVQNSLYYFNNDLKNTFILTVNSYLDGFEYTSIIKLRVQEIFDKLYVEEFTNDALAVFFETLSAELNSLANDIYHDKYYLNGNDKNLIINRIESITSLIDISTLALRNTATDNSMSSLLIYESLSYTEPIDRTSLNLIDQYVENLVFDNAEVYLSNGLYVIETDYQYDKFYLDFIEVDATEYQIGNSYQYEIPYKKGLLIKGLKLDSQGETLQRFRVTVDDLEYKKQDPQVNVDKSGNTFVVETFHSNYNYYIDGNEFTYTNLATNKIQFTSNGNKLLGQKMDTANGILYEFEVELQQTNTNPNTNNPTIPNVNKQTIEYDLTLSSSEITDSIPLSNYLIGNEQIQVNDNSIDAEIISNNLVITLNDYSKLYQGLTTKVIVENQNFIIDVNINVLTSTPVLVAVADVPSAVSIGSTVTLTATSSIASLGTTITDYTWNIDGNTYSGEQVNYQFINQGVSSISLTVKNNLGTSHTSNYNINVLAGSTVTNYLVLNPIENVVTFADVNIDVSSYVVNEDNNYTVTATSSNNNILITVSDKILTIGAADINGIHTGTVTITVTDGINTVSRTINVSYQKTANLSFVPISLESKIEIKDVTIWFDDDKERVKSENEVIKNVKPGMKIKAEVEVCNLNSKSSDIDFEDLEFTGSIIDIDIESDEFDLDADKCDDIELVFDEEQLEYELDEGTYKFDLLIETGTDNDQFTFDIKVEKNRYDTHIEEFELKSDSCGIDFQTEIFNIGKRDTDYKIISTELGIEESFELEEGDDYKFTKKVETVDTDFVSFELYEEDELIAYERTEVNKCEVVVEAPGIVQSKSTFDPIVYEPKLSFDVEQFEKEISTKVAKNKKSKFGPILIVSSFMMLILIISVFVYASISTEKFDSKDDSDSRYL